MDMGGEGVGDYFLWTPFTLLKKLLCRVVHRFYCFKTRPKGKRAFFSKCQKSLKLSSNVFSMPTLHLDPYSNTAFRLHTLPNSFWQKEEDSINLRRLFLQKNLCSRVYGV